MSYLILYIHRVYLTPTFCLQNWVEPGVWSANLALGLLRLVSVLLVSSVISWMPKPAAAQVQDLSMCVLAALTRIVPVGKALVRHIWLSVSSGGSGHKSVPVHAMKSLCEQNGRLYAHIKTLSQI